MISLINYSSSFPVRLPHTGIPIVGTSHRTHPDFSRIDTFERVHAKTAELHFSAKKKRPKDLAREFEQINIAGMNEHERQAALEAFALDLFKNCSSGNELETFAHRAGIKVHHAEAHTAIGQLMEKTGAQGFAVYPSGKIPGMPLEAQYHFGKHDIREPGFEVILNCQQERRPLILIRQPINNPDFELYVKRHELFHILQCTFGFYPTTSTNYLNHSIVVEDHLDLLRKLRNPNSREAKDIKSRAEIYKNRQPQGLLDSYGEALRHVTSLDLATYKFFKDYAGELRLSSAMQSHNNNLYDVYKIIKNFSKSPDCDEGRGSRIMFRQDTQYGALREPGESSNNANEAEPFDMTALIEAINARNPWPPQ